MLLSIIIPVYNEKNTINVIIQKIRNVKLPNIDKEIVIIDDGSNDGSKEIIQKIKYSNIRKFYHKKNKGKGAAVRTGFKHVKGDIILIQDADLEYNPNEYYKLIKPIFYGKTQVVYGSRFKGQRFFSKQRWGLPLHYIGNKLLSFTLGLFYFVYITDIETCYKCFTKKIAKKIKLKENDFKIEVEITIQLIKNNFNIIEVPINYKHRFHKEGKKINLTDGLKAFFYLVKSKFHD